MCGSLVFWWVSTISLQQWYWGISRGVDASLFTKSGQFSQPVLDRFSLQLHRDGIEGLQRIVDENPGFLQQLERDLSSLVIHYPALDDQTNHPYLLSLINVVVSLQLIAEKPAELQHFLQHTQDIDALLSLMLRPTEGVWHVAQEERIAAAARLLVFQGLSAKGGTPERTLMGSRVIDALYFQAKGQRAVDRIAERGLLQALWLRSVVPNFSGAPESSGSAGFGSARVRLSLAFEIIVETLKTESDLIRLLSHENPIVALGAARTVGLLVPEHALPAIRYQLVKASSQFFMAQPIQKQLIQQQSSQQQSSQLEPSQLEPSLAQSFALLDALAAYGEQGRIAEPQLKKMIRLTKHNPLHNKIQHTLDQLYGRGFQGQAVQNHDING